ncbi:MAG: autotransporter outer membrane beta-barrel domain-containing protein [Alphaproteobacteria bacterium]|nr:autotransporter outer membrane beta-barrel domain-containing protein [Alphaproteobacteria bacterium]
MFGNRTVRAPWRRAGSFYSALSLGAVTVMVAALGAGSARAGDPTPPASDWLLPTGELRPEMAVAAVAPALANRLSLATLGTAFSRSADFGPGSFCVDDARPAPEAPSRTAARKASAATDPCNSFVWGRLFGETGAAGGGSANGAFGRFGPRNSFDQAGVVTGADLYRTSRDRIGFYGSAATASATVSDAGAGRAGYLGMNAYGFGSYWSHRDPGGWYSDVSLQGSRYDNVRASSSSGSFASSSGWGVAASAETGYVALLGQGYSIIPQAQLIYQRIDLGGGLTPLGAIAFAPTDEYYARVGGRFNRVWQNSGGCAVSTWAEANIWHQFGDTGTRFSNFDSSNPIGLGSDLGGTWAQIGLGIAGQLSRSVSLFGSADYNIAFSQPGHSLGGRAGLRLAW